MRGGHHADIDTDRLRAADRAHLVFLQYAEQFDLQPHRHVANFIEQQRALVGRLEQALVCTGGARERAFLVTEEFGLEQVFRHRAAVDRDEWLVSPAAGPMYRPGQQFLARAALAGDEHARVRLRDHLGLRQPIAHCRVTRDDFSRPVLVDARYTRDLQRFLDLLEQFFLLDRLGQESGIVPCAVIIKTRRPGARCCNSCSRPSPSILSMRRSVMTRSGR